jgi:malonyl-CoA O-methyltransferase
MSFHSQRFDRAASTYGAHSGLQGRMAERLSDLLIGFPNPRDVLEIGCGTGHLTRVLQRRLPGALFTVTDAAPRMLAAARASLGGSADSSGAYHWALFDAEGAEPAPDEVRDRAPFQLAAGNALVQWFPDLAAHLRLMAGLLAPGGGYLVSGFRADNFPELNAILKRPPFGYTSFPGHDRGGVAGAAAAAGMDLSAWEEEELEIPYASPRDFLLVIRALGSARRPETDQPMTRDKLAHLENTYRGSYPMGSGVKATWRPWYALLRKR